MSSSSLKHLQLSFHYDTRSIPYDIWIKTQDQTIDTIMFLGTVQIGKAVEWIAENSPMNTAVIQGAPHWYTQEDGSDVPQFMAVFTKSALGHIIEHYHTKNAHIIAESQAAPAVIVSLHHSMPPQIGRITLLQPLGLNPSAYGASDTERTAVLKQRTLRNAVHQVVPLMHDKKLRHNHRTLPKYVDFRAAAERARYASGLRSNIAAQLKQLHRRGVRISIVCGSRDKLFPPDEISATLDDNGIVLPLTIVPRVPHSPLSTKLGQRLLAAAFKQPAPH